MLCQISAQWRTTVQCLPLFRMFLVAFVRAVDACATGRGLCLDTDHWRDAPHRSCTVSPCWYFFSICLFIYLSQINPSPLSRDESVISRDQPASPQCTHCILVPWIGSAHPRRFNSRQTQLITLFSLTISRFPRRQSDTTKEKPNASGIE